MSAIVTLAGAIAGCLCGIWLASALSRMYSEFYKFPQSRVHLLNNVYELPKSTSSPRNSLS